MIKFNSIYYTGKEYDYIKEAMSLDKLHGNGIFDKRVKDLLLKKINARNVFLVHSCTAALEISALLLDIKDGDEVIMPSYTYVSTANAFVLRGAKIVFVDVDKETMILNLDEVEKAITSKTKAIVPVHYGGVSCDMDRLLEISNKNNIKIIEDAAQTLYSKYKDKYLGTIGNVGCISLHDTKNITSGGEGGLLIINDDSMLKKVELLVEKGTNRIDFLNKKVDKYTWKEVGSSYLMSQLNSSFLLAQLESLEEITNRRNILFNMYNKKLENLIKKNVFEVLSIPKFNKNNGHMFYIKVKDEEERKKIISFLINKKIESVSHYEPLHISTAGIKYGKFVGLDKITTKDSKRILRLPLHLNLSIEDIEFITNSIKEFYE